MQYLDDIIELVEDLPEEIARRCDQIRRWDQEVERLRLECKDIQKKVFDVNEQDKDTLPLKERERLVLELAEKAHATRELTIKKVDMITRIDRLMAAIQEKVNENQYHCKIELEVDSAGCTAPIEAHFLREWEMRMSARNADSDIPQVVASVRNSPYPDDDASIRSESVPRPIGRPRNPFKERTNKGKTGQMGMTGSGSSSGAVTHNGHNLGKKYKKRAPSVHLPSGGQSSVATGGQTNAAGSAPLSAYMRKKREKQREQQKMMEMHARRDEEKRRRHMAANVPNLDISSFCAQANNGNAIVKREESETPTPCAPGGHQDDNDDGLSWSGGLGGDGLGSDDDFDANDMMDLFPSMLPSPPRELMDSLNLKEDSMFGTDDLSLALEVAHADSRLGSSMSNDYSSPTVFAPMGGGDAMSPPYRHYESASATHLTYGCVSPVVDKKKKSLMFGSISDTSIHGRPRKLTDRASELIHVQKKKEKKRKDDEGDGELWCSCRTVSAGEMIECESFGCPYVWFHFECVGLTSTPAGKWICPQCKDGRN